VLFSNGASCVFRKTVTLLLSLIFVSLIQHVTDTRIPIFTLLERNLQKLFKNVNDQLTTTPKRGGIKVTLKG